MHDIDELSFDFIAFFLAYDTYEQIGLEMSCLSFSFGDPDFAVAPWLNLGAGPLIDEKFRLFFRF